MDEIAKAQITAVVVGLEVVHMDPDLASAQRLNVTEIGCIAQRVCRKSAISPQSPVAAYSCTG